MLKEEPEGFAMDANSLIERILAQYEELDRATGRFAARSGLSCPEGCGQCCENPEIQATELEMLPAARAVLQSGKLAELRDLSEGLCVFFEPGSRPGQGRCKAYHMRPLLCRLFGFAAQTDKAGKPKLSVCRVHREKSPEAVEQAVQAQSHAPRFQAEFLQLAGTEPGIGWELLPINRALERALARLHLESLRSES